MHLPTFGVPCGVSQYSVLLWRGIFSPHPISKLEVDPLSAVCGCLFTKNITIQLRQSIRTFHEGGHLFELRNTVRPEDPFVLQQFEHPAVFGAGVLGHELQNRVENGCPGGDLLRGVVYARDGVAAATGLRMLLLQFQSGSSFDLLACRMRARRRSHENYIPIQRKLRIAAASIKTKRMDCAYKL